VSNDTRRDVRQRAEDVAYTAVGVGVLGFQQVQARGRAASARLATVRQDAQGRAAALSKDARAAAESLGTEVKHRIEPVVDRLGQRVDPVVADVRARVTPVLENLSHTARRAVGATRDEEATSWKPAPASESKPRAKTTTKAATSSRTA
jgi:hypothetical protein